LGTTVLVFLLAMLFVAIAAESILVADEFEVLVTVIVFVLAGCDFLLQLYNAKALTMENIKKNFLLIQ